MRRHVPKPDDVDFDARELVAAAARRAGVSLEEWAAAVLADAQDRSPPPRRKGGSDLDALIARMSPAPAPRESYDALMAAVTAQGERRAQDQGARTSVALESMATWIEQAEGRLNEAARSAAGQQDRIVAALSQALSSLRDRLDSLERQVAAERTTPPRLDFPMDEALKALAPVSETLVGLRADMSRLATRLEQPHPAWAPAVEAIRDEIQGLRSGIDGMATREEIAALDAALGSIAENFERGPTSRDLHTLAGSMTVLYEKVQTLSDEVTDGLHRRIGREIDLIKDKIDAMAATGVDRSVIDFLSGQIVDMRQDLAHRAEPQQIARLSDEIETLSRQMSELRLQQVSKSDFSALKSSLDDVCSALFVTATAQETSRIPEQLETLSRRIDVLASRPEPAPADLTPISEQLARLTERMADLSDGRAQAGGLTGTIERLSSRIEEFAEREPAPHDPLMQRFDRIEQELREVGRQADLSGMVQMLRSIEEKLERTPARPETLDALERQVVALAERFERMPDEALHKALNEAAGQFKQLQDEAVGIAERAARTVLNDIRPALPDSGDLDQIKHGFVELKAQHSRSDRKTQETLRAVHDALDALVARLPHAGTDGSQPFRAASMEADIPPRRPIGVMPTPETGDSAAAPSIHALPPADRLEAAVRRLHAAARPQAEEASPVVVDRHGASDAPTPAVDPAADLGTVRASFIAAARRMAQGAATEPPSSESPASVSRESDPGDDAELLDADDFLAPAPSLLERLRRGLDNRRRPLLFGLAFLILAAGTVQILSVARTAQDPFPASASILAPQEPSPSPAPKPADRASGTSVPDAVNVFQSTSLAAGSSPAQPAAAEPAATASFLVDPATVKGMPADAPALLRQAALSGDAAALYEIASRAAEGRGMGKDPVAAVRLFERASQAGLPPAQERLAGLYEKGEGVPVDLKQAAFWYERAALGGNIRAMHNLATLLASGKSGKPDYAAALRWYGEAAESGLRDSQYNMGILLALGVGGKTDRPKAFQWFSLAADQGDPEAIQKRDEMAERLSAAELKAAKAAVQIWRPRAVDSVANQPPVAIQGRTAALDRSPGDRS